MVYLLNSPVLTAFGDYQYRPCSIEEAKQLLAHGFVSAVGHAATAQFLSVLLGKSIEVNRIKVAMQPGERALVFALKTRLEEGQVLDEQAISQVEFELALLQRQA